GNIGRGMVRGFGLKRGALASSVAHDSHNILCVGVNDEDMHLAVKTVEAMQGGLAVIADGEVKASLPLPIAGLMSSASLPAVVGNREALVRAAKTLGCSPVEPFMTLSFLALPVIPELKITDLGLVDVKQFGHVPLFVR
ncbi:MAG: adenine deaminase, partial [Deltaproteobacteria bacterium]|nr:adenine deaminase [Deltaproteobacteria bacterium]